jgi:hypothetical protein
MGTVSGENWASTANCARRFRAMDRTTTLVWAVTATSTARDCARQDSSRIHAGKVAMTARRITAEIGVATTFGTTPSRNRVVESSRKFIMSFATSDPTRRGR